MALDKTFEGTFRKYHGIDEKIHRIHQYLKLMKFGYGRATDHACEEIRNGRITREEGKKLVMEFEYQEISNEYLEDFANFIGWDVGKCKEVIERFRNMKIWRKKIIAIHYDRALILHENVMNTQIEAYESERPLKQHEDEMMEHILSRFGNSCFTLLDIGCEMELLLKLQPKGWRRQTSSN